MSLPDLDKSLYELGVTPTKDLVAMIDNRVALAVIEERKACAEIARSYSIEAYHEIVERGVGNDSPR
jgi:hypothetical protein